MNFLQYLSTHTVLLDGAMGTMLTAAGLKAGDVPEAYNLTHPDVVREIHRKYVAAGSDVLYANTFGANPRKLSDTGLRVEEVVAAGLQLAREAAGDCAYVALDVGPLGALVAPLGPLSFDEAYEAFRSVMLAGKDADLVVIETMSDLNELRAAVLAAKENTSLPVLATVTFEEDGRTFTGVSVEAAALTLEGLGVDALGINCSLGPDKLYPLMERMAATTHLPLVIKANAGLPLPDGSYAIPPKEFADAYRAFVALGVHCYGGCCGTTPAYIRELCDLLPDSAPPARPVRDYAAVCSYGKVVPLNGVRVIGERLNPTGKPRLKDALLHGKLDLCKELALSQVRDGADLLDVNVGVPGIDEKTVMQDVILTVQSVTDAPLQIDSDSPDVIEAALRVYAGRAIVNSTNGSEEKLNRILPLVRKYGACIVGLTMDENGIPNTAQERVAIAERIVAAAQKHGVAKRDVAIDCLTLTVSAEQAQVRETLDAVDACAHQLGVQTVLGVSNVSFGLPCRETVNTAFLSAALARGLTLPILNPGSASMMAAIRSWRMLNGEDKGCNDFIAQYRDAGLQTTATTPRQAVAPTEYSSVTQAVLHGLGSSVREMVEDLLKSCSPTRIVNDFMIPALDTVGALYEKNEIFLPQLMQAAEAAKCGFDRLNEVLHASGVEHTRGRIVIATVQGDVHDIGKNIVATVLSNYGYELIDLGKNVAPDDVVRAALQTGAKLVGLSALMTTTVPAMEKTIRALRKANFDGKIMVGGAVLTESFARQIGADYYAADANAAVRIATEIYGTQNDTPFDAT